MGQEFGRRSFLARSAAVAAGVAVGGGAAELLGESMAGATQSNGPGLNGVSTKRPKRGGNLVIGLNAEEQGFSPTTGRFDTAGFMYARAVFDPLMAISAKGQVVPYLAQSMTPNSDYTAWTITLRPNIKFQDGTPCDGAALLQNIDAQYKSPLVGIAIDPLIASYDQTGPLSVTVHTKNPWVSFPYTLAEQQICFVAAPSMLNSPNSGTDHPIGTGPFTFKEWVPNDHFTAVANENYWRPGLPYLHSITFKPIPDEQARAEALQSGTIQMMHTSDATNIKQFRGGSQWGYVNNVGNMVGAPAINMLMLNCAKPPFNDPLAREILAMGTSAQQYSQILDQGVMAPMSGLYLPSSPYYSPTAYPKYNHAQAKKLAQEYAKKNGGPLSFTSNTVAAPQNIRQAEWFQQVMKNIGVNVTIKTMQQNELINNALFGTFQATAWSQFGGVSPDLNYVWMSTQTLNNTGLSINMARNNNPKIQAAYLKGMASSNQAEAVAAFQTVNKQLGADRPYIWLDRSTWAIVAKNNVQNWNNPKAPGGQAMLGQDQGDWWMTQAWLS
jgi:peptide/nickel transport system substrate-binding protein